MRAQLAVEGGHDPVIAGEHLSRAAGVSRLVAVPEPRTAEIGEHDEGGDGGDEGDLAELCLQHC